MTSSRPINYVPEDPQVCPNCGYSTDSASSVTDEAAIPDVGDVSVCLNCGQLEVFTGYLFRRRPPTAAEWKAFRGDRKLARYIRAIKERGPLPRQGSTVERGPQ